MAKNAISKTTTTTKAVAEIVKFDDMKGWSKKIMLHHD